MINCRYFILFFLICLPAVSLDAPKTATEKRKAQIDTELQKLTAQKKTILNEIYRLELRYEKETIKKRNNQLEIERQQQALSQLENEKKSLIQDIKETRNRLQRALRIMYKSKSQPSFLFLMRIESFSNLYQHYQYFLRIFDYKKNQIGQIQEQVKKMESLEAKIKTEQRVLLDLKESIQESIKELQRNKNEHLKLMERVNTDYNHFMQLLEELKTQTEELDKVIADQPYLSRIENIKSTQLKGRMPRPIQGKLLNRFGKVKSTKFNTYVFNNGIKIRPERSDDVKAVFDGVVVFASYFKAYGNLIILRHSKDLYTLYGYCSEFSKAIGDWVKAGEKIAKAGNTGSIVGKALYFEVRRGIKSEDPLLWFSKK